MWPEIMEVFSTDNSKRLTHHHVSVESPSKHSLAALNTKESPQGAGEMSNDTMEHLVALNLFYEFLGESFLCLD